MEITIYQRQLMEHTISGPNRNWFGTSKNCLDGKEFERLVAAGFATSETPPAWMGDEVIYRLTPDGRKALGQEQKMRILLGEKAYEQLKEKSHEAA